MTVRQVELLNPVAKLTVKEQQPTAKRLGTLRGRIIGIVEPGRNWRGYNLFTKRLEELLPERYGVRGFVRLPGIGLRGAGFADRDIAQIQKRSFDEFANKVDCAIVGAGF